MRYSIDGFILKGCYVIYNRDFVSPSVGNHKNGNYRFREKSRKCCAIENCLIHEIHQGLLKF